MSDEPAVPGHGTTHDIPDGTGGPDGGAVHVAGDGTVHVAVDGAAHVAVDGAVHDTPDGGHHDPHAAHDHGGMGLGPVDWTAWGIGLLGVAAGLVTAFCFALSTGYLG